MKTLLNKEHIKKINDMGKEFSNLSLGDNYKNAQIGIDLNNKIKIDDD